MDDILDLHHEELDYEEEPEDLGPPAEKKLCRGCPAEGCNLQLGSDTLREHWANFHQKKILLVTCPFRKCRFRSRSLERLGPHLVHKHKLSTAQVSAVTALPVLAELKENSKYRDPGDVIAPFSPETLPEGAIGPKAKKDLIGSVEEAIREAAWQPSVPLAPVDEPFQQAQHLNQFKGQVEEATRAALCDSSVPSAPLLLAVEEPPHRRTVTIVSKPATVSRPPPSPESSEPLVAPSLEEPKNPPSLQLAVSPAPQPQLDEDQPWVAPPAGTLPLLYLEKSVAELFPVATECTTTCSSTDPGIATTGPVHVAEHHALCPAEDTAASPPEPQVAKEATEKCDTVPIPAGDQELDWLPPDGQLDDLETWLSSLPEALQAPPSPKQGKVTTRIEAAGGLVTKSSAAGKKELVSGRYLRARLRSLDAAVNCLQKIRRDLQESVAEAHKMETQEKESENRELRRRVRYLEAQLERAQTGHTTLPTKVGDLQNISTTRAYILFPNIGRTSVFALEPEDIHLLNLKDRSEPLSCDHLWRTNESDP